MIAQNPTQSKKRRCYSLSHHYYGGDIGDMSPLIGRFGDLQASGFRGGTMMDCIALCIPNE